MKLQISIVILHIWSWKRMHLQLTIVTIKVHLSAECIGIPKYGNIQIIKLLVAYYCRYHFKFQNTPVGIMNLEIDSYGLLCLKTKP